MDPFNKLGVLIISSFSWRYIDYAYSPVVCLASIEKLK